MTCPWLSSLQVACCWKRSRSTSRSKCSKLSFEQLLLVLCISCFKYPSKYITALQEIRYTMLLMKLGNAQKNGVYLQYQMGRFSTHDASSLVQEFEKPLETQVAQPFPDSELEYITKCRKQKEFRKMFFSRTSRSHLMQFKAE